MRSLAPDWVARLATVPRDWSGNIAGSADKCCVLVAAGALGLRPVLRGRRDGGLLDSCHEVAVPSADERQCCHRRQRDPTATGSLARDQRISRSGKRSSALGTMSGRRQPRAATDRQGLSLRRPVHLPPDSFFFPYRLPGGA